MAKINETILVEMTPEDIVRHNDLEERDTEAEGLMLDDCDYRFNKCPKCESLISNDKSHFCRHCGQRIRFVDYSVLDVIPL